MSLESRLATSSPEVCLLGRAVRRRRLGVLIGAVLFLFLGPFDRQVLHNDHVVFKAWRMYSGSATTECVADYFVRDRDGEREVDRLRVLYDVPHWSRATRRQRTLADADAVRAAGRQLCQALGTEHLVADARCASTRRWRRVESRSRNLCTEVRP
jgi:hypothetical protein